MKTLRILSHIDSEFPSWKSLPMLIQRIISRYESDLFQEEDRWLCYNVSHFLRVETVNHFGEILSDKNLPFSLHLSHKNSTVPFKNYRASFISFARHPNAYLQNFFMEIKQLTSRAVRWLWQIIFPVDRSLRNDKMFSLPFLREFRGELNPDLFFPLLRITITFRILPATSFQFDTSTLHFQTKISTTMSI